MINNLLATILFVTPYQATEAEQAILDMVDKSQHKILMLIYGLTDKRLVDSLIAAHKRGVSIGICMDSTQAAGVRQKVLVKLLQDAGIDLAIGKSSVNSALIHSKIIIVDDRFVESGSLNYSPSGLQQDNIVDVVDDPARAAVLTDFWTKVNDHIRGIK